MGRILIYLAALFVVVSVGCIGADKGAEDDAASKQATTPPDTPAATASVKAPDTSFGDPVELVNLEWVNSEPQKIANHKGKVILLEFWNRFCTRCQRLHPEILEYRNKYSSDDLVILTIHVPATPDDKDPEFFKGIVEELNIEYPVALDNNYENWNNYGVEYTGTLFLIDRNGKIRYMIGIGTYDTLKDRIKELLAE